jgi:glycosyltransferase involved in cell wall biosynthesis
MAHILMLTPQLPYPATQGTSLRNFHIISGLAAVHTVTLLSFLEPGQSTDAQIIQPLLDLCDEVITVDPPLRTLRTRLAQLLTTRLPDMAHRLYEPVYIDRLISLLQTRRFDAVQIEGIELARMVPVVREHAPQSKILFDAHNAETELQWRNFLTDIRDPRRWPAALYSLSQVRRLRRFERGACRNADWVTAVSTADQTLLQKLAGPETPISMIPNSIDVQRYAPAPDQPAVPFDILFTGKMDYRPNIDAMLWFADTIWPLVQEARPETTWAIVGQKPHPRLDRLHGRSGITITGWVEQVRPYFNGSAIFIMPFRVGSGTRLKLIQAMAAGKAIVSTPIGAEGFPVTDGKNIILAQNGTEFAAAIVRLLRNPAERSRLGLAAYDFAQEYDWRVVTPQFLEIYRELLPDQ